MPTSGDISRPEVFDWLVRREQARAIGLAYAASIPISFFLSATVAVISLESNSKYVVFSWFFLNSIVVLSRYILYIKHKDQQLNADRFLTLACIGSLAMGINWSFVPLFLINAENPDFASLICIICGICAGASVQGAPYIVTVAVFVCPLVVTTASRVALSGGRGHYILAINMLVYLAFMLKSGKSAQEAFRANSRLKHEAAALAVSLRTEHEKSVAANSQLYQLANHDSLTGLFNRAAFSEALDGLLDVARATPDASVTLFLIDMDHFKSINDTLGHKAGDDVLKEVATRLRAASAAHDVVARLGGDEFAILRPTTNGRLDDAAEALIAATNGAFLVGGRPITIGISVGIATFPDDCVSSVELFTRADLALYAAKHAGRRRAQHFEKGMLTATELLWDIEHDLQQALDDGALEVWYQPQVALVDGKLVGLEALIRWNHPRHGWISPPQIVAAAQRTNSSHLLTGYVLKNAGTQLSQLTDMGRNDVRVSVNISPNELDQYDLPELLRGLIERQRLDPRRLELEITEEAFVSSETAIATLKTLSAMNFRLAIDDFGTGCSSISYFRSLHVDRIKIDRSFVTGFCEREGDRTLVQTMLGIGCSLGIEVIAEGIETAEEAELLLSLGCQIAQGYFFARALAPQALEAWMLRQLLPRGRDAGSLEIDGVMAIADTA